MEKTLEIGKVRIAYTRRIFPKDCTKIIRLSIFCTAWTKNPSLNNVDVGKGGPTYWHSRLAIRATNCENDQDLGPQGIALMVDLSSEMRTSK